MRDRVFVACCAVSIADLIASCYAPDGLRGIFLVSGVLMAFGVVMRTADKK